MTNLEFDSTDLFNSGLEGFNVSAEYVPDPLVPDGTYKGIITKVEKQSELGAVKITIQLQGNEGCCSDGNTPIDGKQSDYTLWLPKKGDELIKSQFSNLTKRQEAIRGIKKFADKMKIKVESEKDIEDAVTNNRWISLPVLAKVKSRTYNGNIYNQVKSIEALTS